MKIVGIFFSGVLALLGWIWAAFYLCYNVYEGWYTIPAGITMFILLFMILGWIDISLDYYKEHKEEIKT